MADTKHNPNRRTWGKTEAKKRVSIFLPADLHQRLKLEATKQKATLTFYIENLLRKSA